MAPAFERKLLEPQTAADMGASLARPLVFTNGVFDVLHRGHVTYLARARALGSALIVALNSDASARRLGKGADRPVNPLEDRMALIAALESVDYVTWFDDRHPARADPGGPPGGAGEGRRLADRRHRRREGSCRLGRPRRLDSVRAPALDHRATRAHPTIGRAKDKSRRAADFRSSEPVGLNPSERYSASAASIFGSVSSSNRE